MRKRSKRVSVRYGESFRESLTPADRLNPVHGVKRKGKERK